MDPITIAAALIRLARVAPELAAAAAQVAEAAKSGGAALDLYLRLLRGEQVSLEEFVGSVAARKGSDAELNALLDSKINAPAAPAATPAGVIPPLP